MVGAVGSVVVSIGEYVVIHVVVDIVVDIATVQRLLYSRQSCRTTNGNLVMVIGQLSKCDDQWPTTMP